MITPPKPNMNEIYNSKYVLSKLKIQLNKERPKKSGLEIACEIIDQKKYLKYKLYKDLFHVPSHRKNLDTCHSKNYTNLFSKYSHTTSYR